VNFTSKQTGGPIASAKEKPRIESGRLFQGNSEIIIVHRKEEYNLRIGKLIRTK